MAIYKVKLIFETLIEAGSLDGAFSVTRDCVKSITSDTSDFEIDVEKKINSLDDLPEGWDGMCFPYGGNGKDRLKDILPEK